MFCASGASVVHTPHLPQATPDYIFVQGEKSAKPWPKGSALLPATHRPYSSGRSCGRPIRHINTVQIKSGASVAADGTFAVQLSSALRAGQTIVLEERLTDASQNQVASFFSTPIPVHFAGDWGRVKTYFTSGILMAQDQDSFSQSSLFLSFLMDKAWVLPRPVYGQSRGVPGIDTFFKTRLTSVPVTAQPCPTANTSTTGQCSGTSSNNTDQFNTFLTSQKSARLAVGAYLPFVAKVWAYNGVRNALFVAPPR